MMLKLNSIGGVCLVVAGLCAAPQLKAEGVVNTCKEATLLVALAGGGKVTFSCSGTITLTTPISISSDTTIDGTGQNVSISGGGAVQIFTVPAGVELKLNKMTLANGFNALWGGAINNTGSVIITDSSLLANSATFLGGAVFNAGTLVVKNSTFAGNNAPDSGGGAILNDGTADIADSTFSGNTANSGGGVNNSSGTLNVSNSTFYGNSASDVGGIGGGILNDDTAKIVNSTFSSNSASYGGGIDNDSGQVTLLNSIVANSTGGNCSGLAFLGGGNLSSDESCPGIQNEKPRLGPLQFNGGPTDTMALRWDSPAIDAAIEAYCPAIDQRGVPRPQGPRCDIGAYERASVPTSGRTCITFYNDFFFGDVTVSDGQNCGFVSGGVLGKVEVKGGDLTLSRATILLDVQINGSSTFTIFPGTNIFGDLEIHDIPTGTAQNEICGTRVLGDLEFRDNGAAVEIGSALPSACGGNEIGGDLEVYDNSAPTALFNNTVKDNLHDYDNTALTKVVDNTVGNDLNCENNSSIVGGPNKAKHKHGQCY